MRPDRDELACVDFVEMVTDYLEAALTSIERARVSRHLAACDGCTIYLDQIRQTIEAARALPRPPLAAAAGRRLLEAGRTSGSDPADPA